MIRPGTRWSGGHRPEHRGVDTDRDDRHAIERDAELVCDVASRRFGHGHDPPHLSCDPSLHPDEPVPAPERQAPLPPVRVRQLQLAVDGDGVVDGREHGPAVFHHAGDSRTEALVVVDEIEVTEAAGEEPARPQAEREWLGKTCCAHHRELEKVNRGGELAQLGDTERVRFAVQVQARHLHQLHGLGQLRVRGAREHRHRVTERGELCGEVTRVDTLAATTRVAPVDEERDAQAARPNWLWHDRLASPAHLR